MAAAMQQTSGSIAAQWRPTPMKDDFEYVPPDDQVDQDLRCCVCLGWPQDPVILGCPGGHMLCRRCVQGHLCPLDRQPYARLSPPQRPILTLLNRLHVRCPEAAAGCTWTGPRGNVEDHRAQCPFVEMECLHCGLRLLRESVHFVQHVHCGPLPATSETLPTSEPDVPVLTSGFQNQGQGPLTRRWQEINRIVDIYEEAERLNVCFLVDCTGSMGRHIDAVKCQIRWIVQELRARLPSMRLHLAFVGYRDHCDDGRIVTLPFTSSVDEFKNFVADIRARGGGGDGPEDVHGGVEEACGLDWATGGAATRVLIHIGDYPAHGRRYNDCPGDSYPNGDPRGLDLESLMRRLQELTVQYVFGHITEHTTKMIRVLNEVLGNYIDSKDMANVELVAEAVTASVHTSVASTVSTLSTLTSAAGTSEPPVVLSDEEPKWDELAFDTVLIRECHRVQDVSELFADADPAATRQAFEGYAEVQLAYLPFSQGETRVARHAKRDGASAVAKHLKQEIEGGEDAVDSLLVLSEVSSVAAFLAELFSASQADGERVTFLSSAMAEGPTVVPFNIEEALPAGEFKRFSNNVGWWEHGAPSTLMKFTRFTHEATKGHMMVVDLQGMKTEEGWLLTDPCVLCEDVSRFGSGNLGPQVMDRCLTALRVRLDEAPETIDGSGVWRAPRAMRVSAADAQLDVDAMIKSLTDERARRRNHMVNVPEGQIHALLAVVRDTFLRQPALVELDAPIKILGDIHGQFHDLLDILDAGGLPPDSNYLTLGDYVDRGKFGLETLCLLLAYKVKYPENFFMLRGNHECASITRIYGFYDECKRRHNIRVWKRCCDVFNCLPPAAVIDGRMFAMHGGISPSMSSFDDIRSLVRPCEVPDTGLLCDLLWNDPDKDVSGWIENDRGVGFTFGADVLANTLNRLNLDCVVRAHQVVEDGYEFFSQRQLVTVFSAPNYCGEFNNAGAMMEVQDDLLCTFKIFKSDRAKRDGDRTR